MVKKITFTMSVIYDEEETYASNALYAIEHEMGNLEGIYEWEVDKHDDVEVEYNYEEETE